MYGQRAGQLKLFRICIAKSNEAGGSRRDLSLTPNTKKKGGGVNLNH